MVSDVVRAADGDRALVNDAPAGHHPSGFDPSRLEWTHTGIGGDAPNYHGLIYVMGRDGDVFGPIACEMVSTEAWAGCMLSASNDIIAYALAGDDPHWPTREKVLGDIETRFWSIVDRDGLTGLPSDMWAALDILVTRAAKATPVGPVRERLQSAWDCYPFGLPPIDFTDAEAEHLVSALRDSDGSPQSGDGLSGSVHDSAGRETASPNTQVSETPSDTLGEKA